MGHPAVVTTPHYGSLLALAVGLAMDATAVSAARGLAAPRLRPVHFVLVAGFFGGFQALMPLLGWLLGSRFGRFVEAWDHWLAFGLLGAIGVKMMLEARSAPAGEGEEVVAQTEQQLFGPRVMLLLAIATSIDALAAGITLPMLGTPLVVSLATIGLVTGALSALGLAAGRRFGARLGRRLDLVGGVVLIGLGTKILIEHLWLQS